MSASSSASSSPFVLPSYKFHGSSANIVKDHIIEKQSISRRASQQLGTYIMMKNRSKSKLFAVLKSLLVICVLGLFYLQFNQGNSINKLIHSNNLQLDHYLSSHNNPKNQLITNVDLSLENNKLLESIVLIISKNEPIFESPISINNEKIDTLQGYKHSENILTQDVLLQDHFMELTETQESTLMKSHSQFIVDLYSKMHNLIKIYHLYYDDNNTGVIVYNDFQQNFKECIIKSRITVDSILKTSKALAIQIVFHRVEDENNEDFKKLCLLDQVECINLKSDSLFTIFKNLNDSILSKLSILFSNKFDKLVYLQSGSVVLNKIDDLLKLPNQNLIFWSELNDKRLTSPFFYNIADSNNVYGQKRERIRYGKDETLRYFAPHQVAIDQAEVAFHDMEDTLVDSTTDSSIIFINKKSNLNVILLSMYYDFYNSIFEPLLSLKLPQQTVPFNNEATKLFEKKYVTENSISETLLLSSFALNNKYYQVFHKQESINNGVINFNPIQDFKNLNTYYNKNLKELLPTSHQDTEHNFKPDNFINFINNKDADIKPLVLTDINFQEIFNKEKFFNNVFDHDYLLNNNEVDPDLILSDLILGLKKIL